MIIMANGFRLTSGLLTLMLVEIAESRELAAVVSVVPALRLLSCLRYSLIARVLR